MLFFDHVKATSCIFERTRTSSWRKWRKTKSFRQRSSTAVICRLYDNGHAAAKAERRPRMSNVVTKIKRWLYRHVRNTIRPLLCYYSSSTSQISVYRRSIGWLEVDVKDQWMSSISWCTPLSDSLRCCAQCDTERISQWPFITYCKLEMS